MPALGPATFDHGAARVREPKEFAVGALPGAVDIHIGDPQRRLREIPAEATPVFLCRSGTRSLRGCAIAINGGFASRYLRSGGGGNGAAMTIFDSTVTSAPDEKPLSATARPPGPMGPRGIELRISVCQS
jgi:rhodanese-related sulfurtransferase